jgi:hypothetical protein
MIVWWICFICFLLGVLVAVGWISFHWPPVLWVVLVGLALLLLATVVRGL